MENYANIEEAKKAFFSHPEFKEIQMYEVWVAKISALEAWCRFAEAKLNIAEIALIGKQMLPPLKCDSPLCNSFLDAEVISHVINLWKKLSLEKVELATSFNELNNLLEDDSIYYPDQLGEGIIIEKMLQTALSSEELDVIEEKNCYVRFVLPILKRRVEIARTCGEIERVFNQLSSEEDRDWAFKKWLELVKTAKEIRTRRIMICPSDLMLEEVENRRKELYLKEAETAFTIEELKEVYEGCYYGDAAEVLVRKRWDKLSLKEVEAASTIEELTIAQNRSRDYSQAWYIAKKKIG